MDNARATLQDFGKTDKTHTTADALESAALPRLHESHSDPKVQAASAAALPANAKDQPVEQKSPAKWAYERLIMYIQNFEKQLDGDHEVAMGFAGGEQVVMRIEGMGFFDPDMVTYYRSDGGGITTQQVLHVTQLNVMLRALPKPTESAEANRIGFRLAQDLEKTA